jgi:hypothetical protein
MFIDNPTVPTQLEVLIDLLHTLRQKTSSVESVRALLQPKGLPGLSATSKQATHQLGAARELKLVLPDENGNLRLTYHIRDGKPSARDAIITAFDDTVLSSPDVEPWFGRFFGFLIAQEDDWVPPEGTARLDLLKRFDSALAGHIARANPLNDTKLSHYLRWYTYTGMGWRDPAKRFIPDPTDRLRRALPKIFTGTPHLDAGPFMSALIAACPELDGGSLFLDAASDYDPSARECTRALAVALRNLHDEGLLRLECPKDSLGWSLERGGSVRDQMHLKSDRFDRVVLLLDRKQT